MGADPFTAMVREAIRASLERYSDAGVSKLAAYALCTDDDLRSLYCTVATCEVIEASTEPDFRFLPTEWPLDLEDGESFGALSRVLWDRADANDDFAIHQVSSFGSLVQALEDTRRNGLLDEATLLLVCSTDPGAVLTALEGDAVLRLNGPQVHQEWTRWRGPIE